MSQIYKGLLTGNDLWSIVFKEALTGFSDLADDLRELLQFILNPKIENDAFFVKAIYVREPFEIMILPIKAGNQRWNQIVEHPL